MSRVSLDETQQLPRMKTFSPLLLLLVGLATVSAQEQLPIKTPPPPKPVAELKKFNLEFSGGTPEELVAAISKAQSQPLNVVIPVDLQSVKIMPVKIYNATVEQLFDAIQLASTREVPVPTYIGTAIGTRNSSVQFKTSSMGFRASGKPVTDATVWAFFVEPSPAFLATMEAISDPAVAAAPPICQYFQLAGYLEDRSVEDITTAIQTGWKMLKANPMPQLSFHQETKLLIAVGPAEQIALIPQILDQLARDDSPAAEKIAKWQQQAREIQENKAPGWEKELQILMDRIEQVVRLQEARLTLHNSGPTVPSRPPRVFPR